MPHAGCKKPTQGIIEVDTTIVAHKTWKFNRRITMKRVIGVTDDGSDFIVADTKTIRYIAFAVSMKIYSLIRQVVHG